MTEAQQRYLDLVAAAEQSVKVPASCARALESYGYLHPTEDGWRITAQGREHLAGKQRDAEYREVNGRLTRKAREWATRVAACMQAHESLGHDNGPYSRAVRYAEHVIAAEFDGITPAPPDGPWDQKTIDWVTKIALSDARLMREFVEAEQLASERGVVTSLSTYRERRPGSTGDAA